MLRHADSGLEWLEFELLANCERIDFRVFLRHGGCSQGEYSSLNLGAKGDHADAIQANFLKVKNCMQCPEIIHAEQCHAAEIALVSPHNKTQRFVCDGLSTRQAATPLLVKHADCQAACLYDPIEHCLAVVHCGWRGNVQNIYGKAVEHMQACFGSKPSNILVCVSPSLGPEKSEFIHYRSEFPQPFWDFQYRENYFDLWALSAWQLRVAGILPHHMQFCGESTWANSRDYFSYRRSKKTGNHGSVAILKK